jgi:hypothetical protein
MAAFRYTATASAALLSTHTAGKLYTVEFDLTESLAPSRKVVKDVKRASSGRTETLYHSADAVWSIGFAPVKGYKLEQLREFLRSTATGAAFDAWLYGDEASPVRLRRTDEGTSRRIFMAVGSPRGDVWDPGSIEAIEV